MICFQISIFEPLETTDLFVFLKYYLLWFAFKLVSLNHWKQPFKEVEEEVKVVICFQISIFEPLETTRQNIKSTVLELWFAFKLVSLNHWKQLDRLDCNSQSVVICFQISIFEPLETTITAIRMKKYKLWFAFKLVSLNHWKQRLWRYQGANARCDLLSN